MLFSVGHKKIQLFDGKVKVKCSLIKKSNPYFSSLCIKDEKVCSLFYLV